MERSGRSDGAWARRSTIRTWLLALVMGGAAFAALDFAPLAGGGVSAPDLYGYQWVDNANPGPQVAYNWVDITATGTDVGPRTDNEALGPYPLGFAFVYYGFTYTKTCISNNGVLWLTQGTACIGIPGANQVLPNPSLPRRRIAAFWDDLYTGGAIYYETRGVAPYRQLVAAWVGIDHAASPGMEAFTFEAILYETSSVIRFQYLDTSYNNATLDFGASASVGIENQAGTIGLNYSFNTNIIGATLAVEFQAVAGSVFKDSFETPQAWTPSGFWHLANDALDPCYGSGLPPSAFTSAYAFAYHDDTAGPNQCTYDNGSANAGQLTSPPIDLAGLNRARLAFQSYFDTECTSPSCAVDDLRVLASSDNLTFDLLVDASDLASRRSWSFIAVDLTAYAGDADVWVRFEFDTVDALANNYGGWYIDNVVVDDMIPPPFDTLSVSAALNQTPATVQQGEANVPMLRLDLSVDVWDVTVDGLWVTLSGLPPDAADRTAVAVWADGDANLTFTPFVDTLLGSNSTGASAVFVDLVPDVVVTAGTPAYLFVAYDISAAATAGDWVGARLENAASVEVLSPDVVNPGAFPLDSYSAGTRTQVVAAGPDEFWVTPTVLAPAAVNAGATNVPMLRLDFLADTDRATFDGLNVLLSGLPPSLSDISQIRLWLDDDRDGVLTPSSDTILDSNTFSGPITTLDAFPNVQVRLGTNETVYVTYDIAPGATAGDWVGANITAASDVLVLGPETVLPFPFPIETYQAGSRTQIVGDLLLVVPAILAPATAEPGGYVPMLRLDLSTAGDVTVSQVAVTLSGLPPNTADVSFVELWLDDGDGTFEGIADTWLASNGFVGPVTLLNPSPAVAVSAGAPATLFVAYSISGGATIGNWIGARIAAPTDIDAGTDAVDPANFPIETYQPGVRTQITADVLAVTAAVLAPAMIDQWSAEVPMLRLDLSTATGIVYIDAVQVTLTGLPPDPADVSWVRLFLDDGDLLYEPFLDDAQVGGNGFVGITATVDAFPDVVVPAGVPQALFIAYDIAPTATFGNWIGASVAAGDLVVWGPDAVDPSGFPFDSYQAGVRTEIAPAALLVTATSLAPASVLVGAGQVPMLQLDLDTAGGAATFDALTVTLTGLPPAATDLLAVDLYRDDGDGVFEPFIDPWVSNSLLGLTVFLNFPDFTVYPGSPERLFVVYNVAYNATLGHYVGASIAAAADVVVLAPDVVDAVSFPIDSYQPGVRTLIVAEDTLVIVTTNTAPATVEPGQFFVPMLRLDLSTATGSVTMSTLTVAHSGLPPDPSDVSAVTLWRDDGDGVFEPFAGDSWLDENTIAGATRILNPNPDLVVIAGAPVTLYLSFAISGTATAGNWIGARISAPADVAVIAPDGVDPGVFPIDTYQAGVRTVITRDTLVVAPTLLAPASVEPGATNVPLLQLDLSTATRDVSVISINVTLTGLPPDPADLSYAVLWRDNGDGVFDPVSDIVLNQGAWGAVGWRVFWTIPTLIVAAGAPVRVFVTLSIAPSATVGNWIGLQIASPGDIDAGGDLVDAAPFPIDTYQPGVRTQIAADTLVVVATVLAPALAEPGANSILMLQLDLSTATGDVSVVSINVTLTGLPPDPADVVYAILWRDNGDGVYDPASDTILNQGPWSGAWRVFLPFPNLIVTAGAPVRVFVTLSIAPGATLGNWIGLRIAFPSDIDAGADLVDAAPFPIDTYQPGVRTQIWADTLVITPTVLAPAVVSTGAADVPMLQLDLSTATGDLTVATLTVTQSGTPPDPADVATVFLWQDDGDGTFDPALDTIIAGNGAAIPVRVLNPVNFVVSVASPVTLFVTYEISAGATVGNWVGASLLAAGDVSVLSPDRVDVASFPIDSYLAGVRTQLAPDTLAVAPTILAPNAMERGTYGALLQLDLSTTGIVAIDALTLTLSGSPPDPLDIEWVRVLRDDGDGVYEPFGDFDHSPGTQTFAGLTTTFDLVPDVVVSAAASVRLFVEYGILLASTPGNYVGVRLAGPGDFVLVGADVTDPAAFPIDTYAPGVRTQITADTLVIVPTVLAPATVVPGQGDVPMFRLDMSTATGDVLLDCVRITLTGLPPDPADVLEVDIWLDNGDGLFDSIGDTIYDGAWVLGLTTWLCPGYSVLAGAPVAFFVTYDLETPATVGNWIGAGIAAATEFDILGDQVSGPFPVDTYVAGTRTQIVAGPNTPPTLDWTGEPGYTADGVEPNTGYIDTPFIFRVRYTDADNDPPLGGVVLELEQPSGTPVSPCPCTMAEVDPSDTNYADGKLYTLTRTLARATDYVYAFTATDGTDLVFTSTVNAPDVLNRAPTLTFAIAPYDNGVNPDAATAGSSFTFQVIYTDADDDAPDAPGFIRLALKLGGVTVAGSPYLMAPVVPTDTNYADGALFTVTVPLAAAGTAYELTFEANDGFDDATPVGFDAPDVTAATGTIRGTVRSDEGVVAGATVEVLDAGGNVIGSGTTDASGNFAIGNVPFGTYTVRVRAEGYEERASSATVSASTPSTDLTVSLVKTAGFAWWLLLIPLIVALVLLLFFFMLRKKKKPEEAPPAEPPAPAPAAETVPPIEPSSPEPEGEGTAPREDSGEEEQPSDDSGNPPVA